MHDMVLCPSRAPRRQDHKGCFSTCGRSAQPFRAEGIQATFSRVELTLHQADEISSIRASSEPYPKKLLKASIGTLDGRAKECLQDLIRRMARSPPIALPWLAPPNGVR
jgi:hypothetical protein